MKELLRTTDPLRLARALDLLEQQDIPAFQFDQHMSVLEGSIGALLPQRLMVADRDHFMASAILRDAGLDE